ncbi:MAG: LysR family transcriptional regulator [Betaproteobacteria bacterium]|nr:LysR family transcriptional regulator [Betaproteobacteria bacterium]MBU6512465.1 LysR family transcriptional regulator [Betaproteobacteria bacterium]MDE1954721.1 LysR family transcriptional regulator [Betaproteobacteria bacterium]MDE2152679.1 LysR family transcriptional regulator [Betaproteobacteria bacterium]MDE2480244.1 LysR family transcriptional regulator [Betaproteobacteria bacterium]
MDMRQLRYFVQIVESGSLAKASQTLYVSQPSLSQQLAKLEDEIGRKLLNRTARGVGPTPHGQALYNHAIFLLRQFNQTKAIARQEVSQLTGQVCVGLAPTTLGALGLPLLERIRGTHPGILLNIIEGMSGHLEQLARAGQFDIAVLFRKLPAIELVSEPLLDEQLFVIASAGCCSRIPSHVQSLSLREVAELPLILPTAAHGLRRRLAMEFEHCGVPLQPVAEIDSLSLLMNCVERDIGLSIQPVSALFARPASSHGWRCVEISDHPIVRKNYLYAQPPDKLSPAAHAVREQLRELVRGLAAEGTWRGIVLHEDTDVPQASVPPGLS